LQPLEGRQPLTNCVRHSGEDREQCGHSQLRFNPATLPPLAGIIPKAGLESGGESGRNKNLCSEDSMAIQKKLLINNLTTVKKAMIATSKHSSTSVRPRSVLASRPLLLLAA